MSAITAARSGASVAVLEHTPVSGKKLLSTGNGRCNFTNAMQSRDCYRGNSPDFVMASLTVFSEKDARHFFEEIGVYAVSKNGYFYPRSGQASAIRDALVAETKRRNIRFFHKTKVTGICKKSEKYFQIQTEDGMVCAKSCILATGGSAAPKTGSDGSGYALARSLGHTVKKPLPALVPLISAEPWLSEAAGVRAQARIRLQIDGKEAASDTGELQFTKEGISGIPTFQVSRFASIALDEGRNVTAQIDFLPEFSGEQLTQILFRQAAGFMRERGYTNRSEEKNTDASSVKKEYKSEHANLCCGKTWQQILGGLVNQKIAQIILRDLKPANLPVAELPEKTFRKQLDTIVRRLKDTSVRITATGTFSQAQVTCGGVLLKEVGADMQSKLVPGLYFAGEILDVDGICGGYNLQWAWTSGYLAGSNAGKI
ncbi:MAG: NAD(P)/FAD-dependent oxidoreductase [Clostridiales bacterium]|nr:NAD(P)/FAD-dependent oxidoreductase [Clostridiales bacterium]